MSHQIFIAGTGRLGTGLGLALRECGQSVVGLWNRGVERAAAAAGVLQRPVASGALAAAPGLERATCVLVCVSDRALAEVGDLLAAALASRTEPPLVAHTSGGLPANVLAGLAGARRACMHPLAACSSPAQAAAELRRCLYVLEGEPAAIGALHEVPQALSGRTATVEAAHKARYHAAAVMASNLAVALLDLATAEAEAAGLSQPRADLCGLAMGALRAAAENGFAEALTGPLARGDHDTIARHLEALGDDAQIVYRALSLRAVELARAAGLDESAAARLVETLRRPR